MANREWHLITPEYPPQIGGVADYSASVARGLADHDQIVHVWSRISTTSREAHSLNGIVCHDVDFSLGGLQRLTKELNRFSGPRRLLIQYVPHGYGWRGMNVSFAAWVAGRRWFYQDDIRVMLHEVAYPWVTKPFRHNLIAAANRLMAFLIVRSAHRIDVSIPTWADWVQSYANPRTPIAWLPIPSAWESPISAEIQQALRQQFTPDGQPLIAHFGTYGTWVGRLLDSTLQELFRVENESRVLLLGKGSQEWRTAFLASRPSVADRLIALGQLPLPEVAASLSAADCVVLPYPDGISSRRTSAMLPLALGVPVVTNRGHLTEPIWNAEVVALGDTASELIAIVCQLCRQPEARKQLGRSGQILYSSRFALVHTLKTLLENSEMANPGVNPTGEC